jgi:2-haloacid dehalogenase
MVAEELDVQPAAIYVVAAHVWDTIGAQSGGCSGALVARPGNSHFTRSWAAPTAGYCA